MFASNSPGECSLDRDRIDIQSTFPQFLTLLEHLHSVSPSHSSFYFSSSPLYCLLQLRRDSVPNVACHNKCRRRYEPSSLCMQNTKGNFHRASQSIRSVSPPTPTLILLNIKRAAISRRGDGTWKYRFSSVHPDTHLGIPTITWPPD